MFLAKQGIIANKKRKKVVYFIESLIYLNTIYYICEK